MATGSTTFPIRFGLLRGMLTVLGCGPRRSDVTVEPERVKVRMGWAFRAAIPRSSIARAEENHGWVGGIGVHGFRGRWLVNGAASGLVALDIEPPARASVCGVPIKLRRLRVSLEDPAAFLAALR